MHETNFWTRLTWEKVEIQGLTLRPIDIKVDTQTIFKGVLGPGNMLFVPINTVTNYAILEKMKVHNKRLVESQDGKYALLTFITLGINNGVKKKDLCYTALEDRFHSTGIEFKLDNAEKYTVDGLFEKLHEIYPHLTFTRGKLPS